jgi:hypothetical protein
MAVDCSDFTVINTRRTAFQNIGGEFSIEVGQDTVDRYGRSNSTSIKHLHEVYVLITKCRIHFLLPKHFVSLAWSQSYDF